MRTDPESIKFQLSCQYLFTLLGSAHVKAAQKMLIKLTPDLTFCHPRISTLLQRFCLNKSVTLYTLPTYTQLKHGGKKYIGIWLLVHKELVIGTYKY